MFQDSIRWLESQIGEGRRFPNTLQMAKHLGLDERKRTALYNTLKGSVPASDNLLGWLDGLGAKIVWPESEIHDTTREVCFVNPRIVAAMENAAPPVPEDYLAVPLTAEPVAAGHGRVPSEEIKSWVVVWKHHESVRFKSNLVAVEIGKGERSMLPLFSPGDILLVNRDDTTPDPPGKIMLVRDPDGGCTIKRVSMIKDDGDYTLTFYSENAREFPPMPYKLNRDYGGNIELAIAGHVVWAWSDVRGK